MNGAVENPRSLRFTAIVPVATVIVAGAAGWIDTDLSATTGTDVRKVWAVTFASGGATMGVRPHGDTLEPLVTMGWFFTFTTVDSAGHVDFYRDAAAAVTYVLAGYWS